MLAARAWRNAPMGVVFCRKALHTIQVLDGTETDSQRNYAFPSYLLGRSNRAAAAELQLILVLKRVPILVVK